MYKYDYEEEIRACNKRRDQDLGEENPVSLKKRKGWIRALVGYSVFLWFVYLIIYFFLINIYK